MKAGVLVAPALLSISFGFSQDVSDVISEDYGRYSTSGDDSEEGSGSEEVLVPIDNNPSALGGNATQNNSGGSYASTNGSAPPRVVRRLRRPDLFATQPNSGYQSAMVAASSAKSDLNAAVNEAKQVAADMRGLVGRTAVVPGTQIVADGGYGMNTSGYLDMAGLNYQTVPRNISGYTSMQDVTYQNLYGLNEFSGDLRYITEQDYNIGLITYLGREFSHQWAKVNDFNMRVRSGWQVVLFTPILFGLFFMAGALFFVGCFINLKLGIASSWLGGCLPVCCGSIGCYLHLRSTIKACCTTPLATLFGLPNREKHAQMSDPDDAQYYDPLPRVRQPFGYGGSPNFPRTAYRDPRDYREYRESREPTDWN